MMITMTTMSLKNIHSLVQGWHIVQLSCPPPVWVYTWGRGTDKTKMVTAAVYDWKVLKHSRRCSAVRNSCNILSSCGTKLDHQNFVWLWFKITGTELMGAYSVHTTYKQIRCHTLKANMSVIVFLQLQSCDVTCAWQEERMSSKFMSFKCKVDLCADLCFLMYYTKVNCIRVPSWWVKENISRNVLCIWMRVTRLLLGCW